MEHIRFAENFNSKLDNKEFTTIRPYEFGKYKLGYIYNIIQGTNVFQAAILNIKVYSKLEDIPLRIINEDTGLESIEEFIELMNGFYKDRQVDKWVVITLNKVDE